MNLSHPKNAIILKPSNKLMLFHQKLAREHLFTNKSGKFQILK